jgi:hypothetical protein
MNTSVLAVVEALRERIQGLDGRPSYPPQQAGKGRGVPPGKSAHAILDLPIEALRLPRDMVAGLRVLGFTRIGDLADAPRAPLTLRFGPAPDRCLDQAMGRLSQPIDPIRSPDLIEVRRNFAEPIAAVETIAADGPERLFGEWWKQAGGATGLRDYFRVENDVGERFWIYRSGDGEDGATGSHRWLLHGIFG